MDANQILCWLIGISCAAGLARLARSPDNRGWLAVFAAVVLLLAVLLVVAPDVAGFAAGAVWFVAILAPIVTAHAITRCLGQGWFRAAARLARVVALLHPADGWAEYPAFVRLSECLHTGDVETARALIDRLAAAPTPFARAAQLMGVSVTGDWDGFRRWVDGQPDKDVVLRNVSALSGYLAALGRAGDHDEMLLAYRDRGATVDQRGAAIVNALLRLSVAVQTGRVETTRALLDGPLHVLPPPTRSVYLAEAAQAAGQHELADATLRDVLDQPGAGAHLHERCRRAQREPLRVFDPGTLGAESRAILDGLEREVEHEGRFGVAVSGASTRPVATWIIAAVLLTIFAGEVARGDPTDPRNLYELGALILPIEATPGETWRFLTAGFLHYGALHLCLNLLGLIVIGRWLERAWKWRLFVACYLAATLLSNALLPVFESATVEAPKAFVGASGGIMGLLGALLGRLVVGRLAGRSRVVRRQLTLFVVLVLVQTAFDLSVPEVSSTSHLIGLAVGFAFGLVVTARMR